MVMEICDAHKRNGGNWATLIWRRRRRRKRRRKKKIIYVKIFQS
jgi:hypothetical protein